MLINARHADELRVAIVEDGILEAYEVEAAESGMRRGNIYRGVVAKVESSLNAAFIDYGAERHGFLPGDDIVPEAYQRKFKENGKRPQVADVLQRGMPILVQVVKEAVGQKGAALTTNLSIAGRYLVLTPFDDTRGVSRKVEDEAARKKLRTVLTSFSIPDGCGVIARTNALDQLKSHLNRDLSALLRLWKRLETEAAKGKTAQLLYSDQDLALQALRDYLDSTIEEVYVDSDLVHRKAQDYMSAFMPRAKTQLIRYEERIPLFARFHLDQQIERIYDRTVSLPSGGSIVIDGTEALTAIDVNSGKSRGGTSHEDTVGRTNVEAAQEVARQLRMRDIGGLVVVDFIDMRQRRNHRKVEKTLREAMKVDRARVTVGRISENGLLEINRQRIKQNLQLRTHRACPTCNGAGLIASPEFVALGLLRRIEARAAAGDLKAVRIALHPELADGVQNSRRQELAELEREFDIQIEIVAASHLHRSDEAVEWKRRQLGKNEPELAPRADAAALTPSDLMKGPDKAEQRAERLAEQRAEKRPEKRSEPRSEPRSESRSESRSEPRSERERDRRPRRGAPASSPAPAEAVGGEAADEEGRSEEVRKSRRRRRRRKRKPGAGDNGVAAPASEGSAPRVDSDEGEASEQPLTNEGRAAEGVHPAAVRDRERLARGERGEQRPERGERGERGEQGERGRSRRRSRHRRRGEPRLAPEPTPEPEQRTEAADQEAAEWHRRRTEAAWLSRVNPAFLDPTPPPKEKAAREDSEPQDAPSSRTTGRQEPVAPAPARVAPAVTVEAPERASAAKADPGSRRAAVTEPKAAETAVPKAAVAAAKPEKESTGAKAAETEAAPARKRAPRRRSATSKVATKAGEGAADPEAGKAAEAAKKPPAKAKARAPKPEKPEKPEEPAKTAKTVKADKTDKTDKPAKAAKVEKPAKADEPAKAKRPRRSPSKKPAAKKASATAEGSGEGAGSAKTATPEPETAASAPPKESLRPAGWPPPPGAGGRR